jgi:ABC-2 type transport system permease protein
MIISSLSVLLGGVFYPVSVLPEWMQKCAFFIPITHSLEGMRQSLINGANFKEVIQSIIVLITFTVILLPIGLWIFNLAVKKAEMDGTLTHY